MKARCVQRAQQRRDGDRALVDGDVQRAVGGRELARGERLAGDDLGTLELRGLRERVGLLEIVGRQQDGHAGVLAQRPDVVPEVRAALRVQAGGRLVQEDERRGVHQAEGDVEAPALAARQLEQRAAFEAAEVQPRGDLGEPARGVGLRETLEPGLRDQLLAKPCAGGRCGTDLCDVPDAAPQLSRLRRQVVPGDGGGPRARLEQRGEHSQRGRLAGAVGPEEADDLAGPDVEVDAAHGVDRAVARLEAAGETARGDQLGVGHDGRL